MTGHVSNAFPGVQDHRTRSSTVNKSPSESMSFITEVICKFIFTDIHMRNNYHPNRALANMYKCIKAYLQEQKNTKGCIFHVHLSWIHLSFIEESYIPASVLV